MHGHGHHTRPDFSRLSRVPRRVWVLLGVGLLVVLALLAWAAFALFGALWQGAGSLLDRGQGGIAQNAARIETVLPGARETLDRARVAAQVLAPEATQGFEVAKDILGQAALRAQTSTAPALPATDVPGEDIAGIPRHSLLVRTAYVSEAGGRQVAYTGRAPYAEVLEFYRRSLTKAGFTERVLAATPAAATVEYRQGARNLRLTLRDLGNGVTEAAIVER